MDAFFLFPLQARRVHRRATEGVGDGMDNKGDQNPNHRQGHPSRETHPQDKGSCKAAAEAAEIAVDLLQRKAVMDEYKVAKACPSPRQEEQHKSHRRAQNQGCEGQEVAKGHMDAANRHGGKDAAQNAEAGGGNARVQGKPSQPLQSHRQGATVVTEGG